MKDIPEEKRIASFELTLALYNPDERTTFLARGILEGKILDSPVENGEQNWGYNKIFFAKELKKSYAEMTLQEKNSISHRGKALIKIKYFLMNHHGSRHIVVPVGIVIKDGKILFNRRNDPHNPEFHRLWEFPGGAVEMGEQIEESLLREVREESGYNVEIVKRLDYIGLRHRAVQNLQVFAMPHVCKILGGDGKPNDNEVLESQWFDPDEAGKIEDILGGKESFNEILPEIKEVIKTNNL